MRKWRYVDAHSGEPTRQADCSVYRIKVTFKAFRRSINKRRLDYPRGIRNVALMNAERPLLMSAENIDLDEPLPLPSRSRRDAYRSQDTTLSQLVLFFPPLRWRTTPIAPPRALWQIDEVVFVIPNRETTVDPVIWAFVQLLMGLHKPFLQLL